MLFKAVPICLSLLLIQASGEKKPISLRGLVNVGRNVLWASGSGATVLRSTDNGRSWQTCPPPGSSTLDLRGIVAWNASHAVAMSAGTGSLSRLYETVDGCKSWHLLFANPDADGFWDALAFNASDARVGVLLGDPVGGRFAVYRTIDGGRNWLRDASPELASDPSGEGCFAASNSALSFLPGTLDIVFGTGGPNGPRIFRFDARRRIWSSIALAVSVKNASSGIFSVHFRSARTGVAVGGDYRQPPLRAGTAFFTRDGGRSWAPSSNPPGGYRSAVSFDLLSQNWVAAGPTGLDVSHDDGKSWHALQTGESSADWNALSLPWVSGSKGRLWHIDVLQTAKH